MIKHDESNKICRSVKNSQSCYRFLSLLQSILSCFYRKCKQMFAIFNKKTKNDSENDSADSADDQKNDPENVPVDAPAKDQDRITSIYTARFSSLQVTKRYLTQLPSL